MKTQNLLSQLADTVNAQSALSKSWTPFSKPEVHPSSQLHWKEQGHSCQATYSDEFGTIELYIEKETHNLMNTRYSYRVSYQYRSPEGDLIARGIWEPTETMTQAKQLAEFQWRQFI